MITDRPLVRRAGMIVMLLLIAGLIIAGVAIGVYLLVRPAPPDEARPEPSPPVETGPTVTSAPPPATTTGTTTEPGPGTGSGTTSIERPPAPPEDPEPPVTSGDLRAVARDYVAAVNDRDEAGATRLTCDRAGPGTLYSVAGDREVTLGEVEVIQGPVASATVLVGGGETALLLERQEDGWCVAI